MATSIDFYYPFDSISNDRPVTAAVERRFWSALFKTGVVGGNALKVTRYSGTTYRVASGVAIIGGAVAGITATYKQLTVAAPALGASMYVVLHLDTTSGVRSITLDAVATPVTNTTQAQLDSGGRLDLVLARVQNNSGTIEVTDMRTFCTSFDNAHYEDDFLALVAGYNSEIAQKLDEVDEAIADVNTDTAAAIAGFQSEGAAAINEKSSQFDAAIAAANTENAGLYGAQGRQGFINPSFAIAQRYDGESWTMTAGTQFTADHWAVRIGGRTPSAALVIDRAYDLDRNALVISNKQYTSSTAAGATCLLQNIEGGVRTFCSYGQTFTVSFDAKATTAQKLAVEPVQILQTGQGGTTIRAQTVNLTTNWSRYSLTFTGGLTPTVDQVQDVLKIGFFFAWSNYSSRFGADQNANNTIYFANMQINKGNSALPCYEPPRAEQLEQCLRYYADMGRVSLSVGAPLATLRQVITSPLPLTRRLFRTPTPTYSDTAGVAGRASAEVAAGGWRHGLTCQLSGNSEQAPVFVVTNTDTAAVTRVCWSAMALDAEIYD